MAEGRVLLTTFIEGVLMHGIEDPRILLIPCPHTPHRGLLMPAQIPWAPGFLPTGLLQAQLSQAWGIPYRIIDRAASTLPVVFDERTSRLPTPWLLRLESLEGQQRLYLTHLLRTKAPDEQLPAPPDGGIWIPERDLQRWDLPASTLRLAQAAFTALKEA